MNLCINPTLTKEIALASPFSKWNKKRRKHREKIEEKERSSV